METSLEVQPDDMMRRHRDVDNPLERLQALEEDDRVIADGISHVDQRGDLFFKPRSE